MKTTMQKVTFPFVAASAMALLLGGCASPSASPSPASAAAPDSRSALACTLPSNCVNSLDGGLAPLRFDGPPAQALKVLRATLAEFPEATVLKADDLSMEVVFTTAVGFKDYVDFKVDGPAQRIDFRSRSSLGLYDFGKNRSRMAAFATRFEQAAKR